MINESTKKVSAFEPDQGIVSLNHMFKTSTGMLKEAFQSVCAFLNCKGGTVLIGVTDKGKIVGQEIIDKMKRTCHFSKWCSIC